MKNKHAFRNELKFILSMKFYLWLQFIWTLKLACFCCGKIQERWLADWLCPLSILNETKTFSSKFGKILSQKQNLAEVMRLSIWKQDKKSKLLIIQHTRMVSKTQEHVRSSCLRGCLDWSDLVNVGLPNFREGDRSLQDLPRSGRPRSLSSEGNRWCLFRHDKLGISNRVRMLSANKRATSPLGHN